MNHFLLLLSAYFERVWIYFVYLHLWKTHYGSFDTYTLTRLWSRFSSEVVLTPASTHQVWEGRWRVIPHDVLPDWLKDNDFLLHGHRPPMPSFRACFRSIFRIHTETGNIWTHLLGNAQRRSHKCTSLIFNAVIQILNIKSRLAFIPGLLCWFI